MSRISGTIEIAAGAVIDIQGDTITNSSGTGIVLDGAAAAGSAGGSFVVDTTTANGSHLMLTGNGEGEISLGAGSKIYSLAVETLENVNNTIFGGGTIGLGDGKLTLVNDASGVIDATPTQFTGGSVNQPLTINTGNTVITAGVIKATGGGVLNITDAVTNTGTIDADDPAGNAVSIIHIDGTLTNSSLVEATDGGHLYISGGFSNSGTIKADGSDVNGASTVYIEHAGTNTNQIKATNGGTLIIDAAVANTGTIDASSGTLTVDASGSVVGTGTIAGNFANQGLVEASGGVLVVSGNVTGGGHGLIDGGATLELGGTFAQNVVFADTNATLQLDVGGSVPTASGSIQGLVVGDKFDLRAISYDVLTTTGTIANGVLTITDGTHSVSLKLVGADYSTAIFRGGDDGAGGEAGPGFTLVTMRGANRRWAGHPRGRQDRIRRNADHRGGRQLCGREHQRQPPAHRHDPFYRHRPDRPPDGHDQHREPGRDLSGGGPHGLEPDAAALGRHRGGAVATHGDQQQQWRDRLVLRHQRQRARLPGGG